MGTAANASTPGWPATGPTARSMSPCAEHWTPVLAPRSSAGAPWISVWALGGTPWPGVPSVVVTHRASPDLLGELRLHLVPLLLGAGTPLFDGGSRPS